jgi:DNA-binding response OmpR family regulator
MACRILVVDDEKKIRDFITFFLKKEGFEVIEAVNGHDALIKFRKSEPDLILLDLMMPVMDGYEVCKEIRKKSDVPIIMLTAVEGEQNHIEGYESGADDYVTKPFRNKILMAKIRRFLKKTNQSLVAVGSITLDVSSRKVMVLEEEVPMSPKEYGLLEYMVNNMNIALSRDQILETVWGLDYEGGSRVVDNHIKKLRSKLGEAGNRIKTVSGFGYKIEG